MILYQLIIKKLSTKTHIVLSLNLYLISVLVVRRLAGFFGLLEGRMQRIKVGECLLKSSPVCSRVLQDSILGLFFFSIVFDPLLRLIYLPRGAFANDIKFVADVVTNTQDDARVQTQVDFVVT